VSEDLFREHALFVEETFSWKPSFVCWSRPVFLLNILSSLRETVDHRGSWKTTHFKWDLQLVHNYLLLLQKKCSHLEECSSTQPLSSQVFHESRECKGSSLDGGWNGVL
jgi:hypothetical protein